MFYRRKILLALLEASGGSLSITDCENLLFLFCQHRGKNYYDFFPASSGATSFLLYQDRERLISLGFLAEQEGFCLINQQLFLTQIHKEDATTLAALFQEVRETRGGQLTHKVYIEYPSVAARSTVISSLVSQPEYIRIQQTWNTDTTPTLFTLGYEGISIDAYLNILLVNNISALIDVRKNPLSMKYGFSKKRFSRYLEKVGISYFHLPNLGISSVLRQKLDSSSAYQSLFDYYRSYILPENKAAIEQLKAIATTQRRTVLTCFEADPRYCHRHEITDYLEKDTIFALPIIHLDKTCTYNNLFKYTIGTKEVSVSAKPVHHTLAISN